MIYLRVPGRLQYRNVALRVVSAACGLLARKSDGAPPRDFEDELISAVGEAFNNIAIHGYRGVPVRDIEVEITTHEAALVVRLSDWGRGFDLEAAPVPELDAHPEGGFGVFIIRAFTDEVAYQPGSPNVMTLTKRFPPGWLLE